MRALVVVSALFTLALVAIPVPAQAPADAHAGAPAFPDADDAPLADAGGGLLPAVAAVVCVLAGLALSRAAPPRRPASRQNRK